VPWSYARVVKASKMLDPTSKLVWLEHLALAHGKGGAAIVSAAACAARIALSQRTVEYSRHDFLRCGLIRKLERGPGRAAGWAPCLPADCRPHARRITDDEAYALAERLDAGIERARKLTSISGSRDDDTTTTATPVRRFEHNEAASAE
jgi:hypothetical protein